MTYPTSADMCRAAGWTAGDILEREDEFGREWIRITAIGEQNVLVRWQYEDRPESAERLVHIDFCKWRKVEVVE